MDPYIEACGAWSVFHHSFISECSRYLNERLPPNYVAMIGDRIELVSDEDLNLKSPAFGPDVVVTHEHRRAVRPRRPIEASAVATLEPQRLMQDVEWLDEPRQLYVQIRRVPQQEVVTEVEVLSPSNKRKGGEDRAAYLAKRRALFRHDVNLVELDLLIGGERLKMRDPLPEGAYYAFVTRPPRSHECEVYAWPLRVPLPTVAVPLRQPDGDVGLDLQTIFARTYDGNRFDLVVQYDSPLDMLPEPDRDWAEQLGHSPEA
jgi:hypothetical protein